MKSTRRWSLPVVGVVATCLLVAACGTASTTSSSPPAQAIENNADTLGVCLLTSAFPLTDGKATVTLDREQLDANAAVLEGDCTYSVSGDDVVTITVIEFAGTVTIAGPSEIDAAIVGFTSEEIGPDAEVGCAIEGDEVGSGVTVGDSGSHSVKLDVGEKITVRTYRDICQFGIGFAPNTNCANTPTRLTNKAIAIDIDKTDCFYQAPVTLTAEVAGGINFFLDPPPIKCSVDINHQSAAPESFVLDTNITASESDAWNPKMVGRSIFGFIIGPNAGNDQFHGSWPLGGGDEVAVTAADGANCRFQIQWTPDPNAATTTTTAPTTTTTTAAPATTTTAPATTTTTVAATTTTTLPTTTTTTLAPTTTTSATTTTVPATTTTIESTTTTAPTTITTAAVATTTTFTTTTTAPSTTTSIAPTTTSVAPTTTAVTTTVPATTTSAPVSTTTTTVGPTTTTAPTSTTIPPTTTTTAAPASTTTAGIGAAVVLAGLAIAGAAGLLLFVRRQQGAGSDQ